MHDSHEMLKWTARCLYTLFWIGLYILILISPGVKHDSFKKPEKICILMDYAFKKIFLLLQELK